MTAIKLVFDDGIESPFFEGIFSQEKQTRIEKVIDSKITEIECEPGGGSSKPFKLIFISKSGSQEIYNKGNN